MSIYLKACGTLFVSVILILLLGKKSSDFGLLLTVAVCAMVAFAAAEYIRPVIDFLSKIETIGSLNHDMIRILLKASGIGLISEICSLICSDSGCASLGKVMNILSCCVILWLSLPLYSMLIDLLQRILTSV